MKNQVEYLLNKKLIFGSAIGLTLIGTNFISSQVSAATSTAKNDISVTVQGSCSVSSENNEYGQAIDVGTVGEIGSGTVFDIYCNDEEGYVVYAVGNGKNTETGETTEGVTDLIGTNESNKIATGLLTSGDTSNWFFKLSNATSGMTIADGFNNNSVIPSSRTKVVSRASGTAASVGDTFTATYSAYIGKSQQPDTYSGGVKYILFHPSSVKPDGTRPSMQDFKCTLGDEETTTLLDTRDGNTYTVAKLADGKCWMTQNLKIQNKKLTTADSDVAGDFTLPASIDKPNSNNSDASTDLHVDNTYDGYYTWYTATAEEGTQGKSSGDVSHSICPKGWRLPTKDEFVALDQALGGTGQNRSDSTYFYLKYTGEPNNFLMGGYYVNGSASGVGNYAWYWSSTANGSNHAYHLGFGSSYADPQNYNLKYYLLPVRCVSRK